MNIVIAILIFSLVVIFHEFGHYTFARKAGIKVNEFSLGMGPRLFSFEKGGTRWSIKLLPLGGSCMMEGEDGESSDENAFGKKSVWARIMVVFGGPLFNFILAFIISLIVIGIAGIDRPYVTEVVPGSPAAEAGIEEGYTVTEIGGKQITIGREIANYFQFNALSEKPLTIKLKSDENHQTLVVNPIKRDVYLLGFSYMPNDNSDKSGAEIGEISSDGALSKAVIATGSAIANGEAEVVKTGDHIVAVNGNKIETGQTLQNYFNVNPLDGNPVTITINRNGNTWDIVATPEFQGSSYYIGMGYNLQRERTGVLGTIVYSLNEVKYWIVSTIDGLGMMITGRVSTKDIAGPVGIVQMIGNTYDESKAAGALYVFLNMMNIVILISANLGVINLLPLPALDGGRLVFLFIEAIRKKPVDPNKEGMVHLIGFAALMVLMVFVWYNDIMRIIK